MAFVIRNARIEDIEQVIPWTTDTFSWGDYVPDRLTKWLTDENSVVLVATVDDIPVALVHAVLLSPYEGWLEAARVHPEHRRGGLGNALNTAGVEWASENGARVVRLATEASNKPAITQVLALGYRQTSSWTYGELDKAQRSKKTSPARFTPGTGPDVDAGWVFWSTSELNHAGRGLLADGWQWRNATPLDLRSGAASGHFFQSPAGWLLTDQPDSKLLRVPWMATAPEDAPRFLEDLSHLARSRDVESVAIKTPNIPWMTEAIKRAGGDPKEILIFSKAT